MSLSMSGKRAVIIMQPGTEPAAGPGTGFGSLFRTERTCPWIRSSYGIPGIYPFHNLSTTI